MTQIVITFDPATGELQLQMPDNLALTLSLLGRARAKVEDHVLQQQQPAVQAATAAALPRLYGNGRGK